MEIEKSLKIYEQTFGLGNGGGGSSASNSNILKAPKAFIKGGTLDPSDTSLNVKNKIFFLCNLLQKNNEIRK